VRTHIETLPNRVDDHCDLIGTCGPHHLTLEVIGVARASMRFVEQGEVDFGHLSYTEINEELLRIASTIASGLFHISTSKIDRLFSKRYPGVS
jgi:hypothetical protein